MVIVALGCFLFFYFTDTATTEIYTLSLHDALPISSASDVASSAPLWRRIAPTIQKLTPPHNRKLGIDRYLALAFQDLLQRDAADFGKLLPLRLAGERPRQGGPIEGQSRFPTPSEAMLVRAVEAETLLRFRECGTGGSLFGFDI